MNNLQVKKNVVDLLHLLSPSDSMSTKSAEDFASKLLERQTLHTHVKTDEYKVMKNLTAHKLHPQDLVDRYQELKKNYGKNKDLDPALDLLSRINNDAKLKAFLAKNTERLQQKIGETENTDLNVAIEEVAQLRSSLYKETCKRITSASKTHRKTADKSLNANKSLTELSHWMKERPYLTLNYVFSDFEHFHINHVLGALPLPSQEHALIEDILYCLGGNSGVHIVPKKRNNIWSQIEFTIDESIDPSFMNLIERILPLCSDFSTVTQFIEENSFFIAGQVKQALASALRTFMKDYLFLIAQLDNHYRQGVLSLQKLWFFVQPTIRTMGILASIVSIICKEDLIASDVLSLLHERTCSLTGDLKAQELTLYLTQMACAPYFENLEKWIYKGIISDPFYEFLVEDNIFEIWKVQPLDYCDDFWKKRYTICRARIPLFLERLSDMILHTGKYLNVIQQCNQNVECPNAEEIVYTLDERQYVEKIEKSFTFASKKLLDLLMKEKDLIGRLKSVKHYFLLDQGDFIVQFMDMADEELRKKVDDIVPTRLESLLELSLRTSVVNVDPYKDDVKTLLLTVDLLSQMSKIVSTNGGTPLAEYDYEVPPPTECSLTGIESFTFNYEVKWPLSLILTPSVLYKYQMLFRQLFHLKHVERVLCNVWLSNQAAKSFMLSTSRLYFPAFDLRQRMLNFVQHLEYYMTFEVIEPAWHIFMSKLHSVSNFDDVLNCHTDFLNDCLKDCMLLNPELLQIVHKLMMISTEFANFILASNKYSIDAEMSSMIDSSHYSTIESLDCQDAQDFNHLMAGENFEQTIRNFDTEFTKNLVTLLSKILEIGRSKSNENLVNILIRLNFNEFYSEHLEKYRTNVTEYSSSSNGSGKKKPPVPPKSPKVVKMKHGV